MYNRNTTHNDANDNIIDIDDVFNIVYSIFMIVLLEMRILSVMM